MIPSRSLRQIIGEERYWLWYRNGSAFRLYDIPFEQMNPEELQMVIGYLMKEVPNYELKRTNVELHPTEIAYPFQTKRFREILDEMYQVHLEKNADYSPYNILVTGMRGCITRLWDKSARFFNLMGLDIKTYEWTEEKMNMVKDEDVNQTIIDWANYCIITRILREGLWGK